MSYDLAKLLGPFRKYGMQSLFFMKYIYIYICNMYLYLVHGHSSFVYKH